MSSKSKAKKPAAGSGASAAVERSTSSTTVEADAEIFYQNLADPEDPDTISIEGLGQLCSMIGVDASADVRALVLAWKLGSSSIPGRITKKEFIDGCKKMNVRNADQIQAKLPSFDPGFMERTEFRDFYKFVFQFNREGTHKTIEKSLVADLLPIVLDLNRAPHLTKFVEFLTTQGDLRITLDQWDSFLQFNYNVRLDLSNWEEGGAWPILFDDYVEWRKKQAS